jgi:hypothetical protein
VTRQVEVLKARAAELEGQLGLPRKTPNSSNKPSSTGQKSSEDSASKDERKAQLAIHAGNW